MTPQALIAAALDPSLILRLQGMTPDPWQQRFLLAGDRQMLLLCCRGAGKSRTVAALATHTAVFTAKSKVLLVSRAPRQSGELFRYVKEAYSPFRPVARAVKETETQLELENGSRVISVPGKEATIRAIQGVTLLIIDEAARVPDDLYKTVRPMIAVSQGRLIGLTTPFGQRGWFFNEWTGDGPFARVCSTWHDCPRITADFIAEETRALGQNWVDQEYNCLFTALEGLVYPDFAQAVVDCWPLPTGRPVGGTDFGSRNPFAALARVLDRDDVELADGPADHGRHVDPVRSGR
jgi:hypothetical protein